MRADRLTDEGTRNDEGFRRESVTFLVGDRSTEFLEGGLTSARHDLDLRLDFRSGWFGVVYSTTQGV